MPSSSTASTRTFAGTGGAAQAGHSGSGWRGSPTGNHKAAVVPWPGVLSSRKRPPHCSTMPWTIDRPRPVPLPIPFVVKNGSVARSSVSLSMPTPWSTTHRRTYSPEGSGSDRQPEMTMPPPSGIASRAFTTRLTNASSSWVASAWTGGRSASNRVSMVSPAPIVRASRSAICATVPARSIGSMTRSCLRAKASMRWVSVAPRSAAMRALARNCEMSWPCARRRSARSRLPRMAESRLLKSCATPPVSLPMASIFCDWKKASCVLSSASCASRRSVRSRVILVKPISSPSGLRIGSMTTVAQKREPSLRTRQPSASKWPWSRAVCSARAGTPSSASSGV